MAQPYHVGAALQVFDMQGCECSDVVILGRGKQGSLILVASYPEGDKAPLTQLVVEALTHLGTCGHGSYAGREWVEQVVLADIAKRGR